MFSAGSSLRLAAARALKLPSAGCRRLSASAMLLRSNNSVSAASVIAATATPSVSKTDKSLPPSSDQLNKTQVPPEQQHQQQQIPDGLIGVPFDTFKFSQRLEEGGFTPQQTEAIALALSQVLTSSVLNLKKEMVTKADHEKNVQMYKVDFTSMRSEFKMQERSDFNLLKADTERLAADLDAAKNKMREEISKLQSGVRLEMSLEKGRIRDDTIIQESKIRDADSRIETEVSAIRTQLEANKYEVVRTIVGIIIAGGGLILAYLRYVH